MVAYLHTQVVSQLVCFDQSDGLIPDDLGGEWRTRHRVNASHLSSHGDKIQKIARVIHESQLHRPSSRASKFTKMHILVGLSAEPS